MKTRANLRSALNYLNSASSQEHCAAVDREQVRALKAMLDQFTSSQSELEGLQQTAKPSSSTLLS